MRRRIISSQVVPSRHGVHCPHDSCAKNLTTLSAAWTMQVWSSMTITAPEPSIDPAPAVASFVISRSKCSAGTNHGAEAPPGIHALSSLSSRIPPPMSKMSSRQVIP